MAKRKRSIRDVIADGSSAGVLLPGAVLAEPAGQAPLPQIDVSRQRPRSERKRSIREVVDAQQAAGIQHLDQNASESALPPALVPSLRSAPPAASNSSANVPPVPTTVAPPTPLVVKSTSPVGQPEAAKRSSPILTRGRDEKNSLRGKQPATISEKKKDSQTSRRAANPKKTPLPLVQIAASRSPTPTTGVSNKRLVPIAGGRRIQGTRRAVFGGAPSWLASMLLHMILLVVLGVWDFPELLNKSRSEIEVAIAEELGEQLKDASFELETLDANDFSPTMLADNRMQLFDPLDAAPAFDPQLLGMRPTSEIKDPSILLALTGRNTGMQNSLLAKYGGTATTQETVRLGLAWLARYQGPDGTWSLKGPYRDGSPVENRAAATAMALLAFQGAGHTHREGEFIKQVANGWQALLQMQSTDGNFYSGDIPNQHLYTQAQATIAVCELYGMTKDSDFRQPAQRAIDYCLTAQAPEGGWKYYPGRDSDTSVTGWYVMALHSALMAGLDVPASHLDRISRFLDSVAREGGSRYVYEDKPTQQVSLSMTAEALLCRQYLGWEQNDPRLVSGVEYILAEPMNWESDQDVYFGYYAAQLTHHMEGQYWERWNEGMRDMLPKHQAATGPERGSWSPEKDRWGHLGGRLYTTCLCIYMLEVYYRHLPIYTYRGNR